MKKYDQPKDLEEWFYNRQFQHLDFIIGFPNTDGWTNFYCNLVTSTKVAFAHLNDQWPEHWQQCFEEGMYRSASLVQKSSLGADHLKWQENFNWYWDLYYQK